MNARARRIRDALVNFCVFFVLVAFVVTCCSMLFISVMQEQIGQHFTSVQIELAAKLTFGNVLFLSLLFTVIDFVRRYFTVDRPVKQILEATQKLTHGDLSVRIPETHRRDTYGFDAIIRDLNRMAAELQSIETLRTDFVSNVSHELKTPLAVIGNYASMLCMAELEDGERLEYAKAIHTAAHRLADLVTNILKLNRLENQQIFPETAEFDLSEQLVQCLLGFEEVWEQKNIEIEAEIPDGVRVKSDMELLALVWNNLLSNAMKFTPEGGTVRLSVQVTDGEAVVSVSDTGCGMSPEVGRHIFDKFYQADTSHATEGNGLGLALVKRVVDITGCTITVQSTPGKGSTFTVRLGGAR